METLTILLADDNDQFLEAECDYLARIRGVNIVGTARSGEDAVQKARVLKPDIVFMEISIPDMNGFEATRMIKQSEHPPHVVMLTSRHSIDDRCLATAVGADAFLQKDLFADEILRVIEAMAESRQMQMAPCP
jgi:DNA-binding NarL/FixJ family response regulator